MRCIHINIRKATFLLLTILINTVQYSDMSDNKVNIPNTPKENSKKIINNETHKDDKNDNAVSQDVIARCRSDLACKDLPISCLICKLNDKCIYGDSYSTECQPIDQVKCTGERTLKKSYICRYCYQTDHWEHSCDLKAGCNSVSSPRATYVTNCTVNSDIVCLGRRTFNKNIRCNWTGGYRWLTALALSVTLGGFGADRFYLGHWQEGIGKLFSFGGLGVWTIIDVILISLRYLGPADGSLYI